MQINTFRIKPFLVFLFPGIGFFLIFLLFGNTAAGTDLAIGMGKNAVAEDMNLLIITLDTMRADRIGAYGYEKAKTPHLDDLVKNGIMFADCYAPVPLTLPAHCSLFTGRYPIGHRVRDNGTYFLSDSETTLAEMLKQNGYDTYAVIASFVLLAKFGLGQGFSVYDDSLDIKEFLHFFYSEITADVVYAKFKQWFNNRKTGKFFAWVHFYDPHLPYAPPEEYRSGNGSLSDLYDGEVAFTDVFVGKVIQDLENKDVLSNTLVVIVGDHGEAFGEHQEYGHSVFCYEENLRVPLIFYNPRLFPKGYKVGSRVSLVDIMPSLLEMYGLDLPPSIQGKSFTGMLAGKREKGKRSFYIESMYGKESLGWAPLTGIIDGPYKYISLPEPELYDLEKDNRERNNLVFEKKDVVKALDEKLKKLMLEYSTSGGNGRRNLTAGDRRRLESLGYVSSSSRGAKTVLDPKKGIVQLNRFNAADKLIDEGLLDLAESELKKIATLDPDMKMLLYYELMSKIYERRSDSVGVINLWREAIQLFPANNEFRVTLGFKLFQMNQPDEAEAIGLELIKTDDRASRGYILLGRIEDSRGQDRKALAYFEKAQEIEPSNVQLKLSLAQSLIKNNQKERAWSVCQGILNDETVAGDPANAEVLSKLGILLTEMNRIDQALQVLQNAAAMDGSRPETWNYLGVVYYRKNNYAKALEAYENAINLDTKFASAYNNLGTLYLRRFLEQKESGMMAMAIDSFNRAIDSDPQLASAYNGRASAFKFGGRSDDAVRDWRKALELKPDFVEVYFNLGIMYLQIGNKSEALKILTLCKKNFFNQLPPSEQRRLDRLIAEATR